MREIQPPNYDYDVKKVVKAYEKALKEIQTELYSLFLTDFQRAQILATEATIKQILKDLAEYSTEWAAVAVDKAAADGVAATIYSLELTESLDEARKIVKFNSVNKRLVAAAIADTQSDLLAINENMSRQAKIAIRKATAEAMRYQLTKGSNHSKDLSKEITKRITSATDAAIIDRSGRRWKVGHYADVVARTNMMNAHREASVNEALSEGSLYGRISKHNAVDKCRDWEGKIVKLVPEAPGNYDYIGDISRKELFHPRCRHVVTPVRVPQRQ